MNLIKAHLMEFLEGCLQTQLQSVHDLLLRTLDNNSGVPSSEMPGSGEVGVGRWGKGEGRGGEREREGK